MRGIPPLTDFDSEEFVFIGEIVNYTNGFNARDLRTTAYGLVVTVKEPVFLPSSPLKYFEVFRITSFPDCSEGGESLEELKRLHRIGSEVQVVAKRPTFLSKSVEDGVVRLEIRPAERGFIVSNTNSDGSRLTDARSEFDYTKHHFGPNIDSAGRSMLPAFEIRKDLLRLKNATTHDQRLILLRKLSFAPHWSNLDFYRVALKYAANVAEGRRLYESLLQRTSPELSPRMQVIWAATDALMKKGFDMERAEYEAEAAIAGGITLDAKKIVKAVMQSFKVRKR